MKFFKKKNGEEFALLDPAEKGRKAAAELKSNIRLTNDGTVKVDEQGFALELSEKQRSYRAGYLDARKDSAKAYNHNKKKAAAAEASKEAAKAAKKSK